MERMKNSSLWFAESSEKKKNKKNTCTKLGKQPILVEHYYISFLSQRRNVLTFAQMGKLSRKPARRLRVAKS